MPRVPIDEQHATGEGGDRFPKLKMTSKGEKARFIILEQPWMEWRHNLRAPVLEGGLPKMKVSKWRDGSEHETFQTDWLGSPFCLGNPDVLEARGVDEQSCPVCALASEDPALKPERRYAVNIVKYGLQGGTWNVQLPLSLTIVVWTFTARTYDDLIALQKKMGPLQNMDVTLECEDANFQRNKMSFEPSPGWDGVEGGQQQVVATWQSPGNRATDAQLKDACGSERPRQQMQDDAERVIRDWRRANAAGKPGVDVGGGQFGSDRPAPSLNGAVDGLLGGGTPAPAAAQASPGLPGPGSGGLDEFIPASQVPAPAAASAGQAGPLGGSLPGPQTAPGAAGGTEAPAAAPTTAGPASTPSAPPSEDNPFAGVPAPSASAPAKPRQSFDELMKGL